MTRSAVLTILLFALLACHVSAFMCGKDNCYDLLGVARNATKSEIRRAYRRLSADKHPDKRPGDEAAKDEFRKIGTAYEILTNNQKRAEYEDFLENPTKYWRFLVENSPEVYAPKSNVLLVITGIIGIMTLIHWLNMNHNYKQTLRRMKESQDFKREVSRLVKSKQAATKEEAEAMINLDVVGLDEPNWRNLIVFKLIGLPGRVAKYALWQINWLVSYKIRKLDYSEQDKHFLIQKNMSLTPEQWDATSDDDKKKLMDEELWDAEKCEEYMRLKRIELNKLGKGKKMRKRHTPSPYSEVEEISMSE